MPKKIVKKSTRKSTTRKAATRKSSIRKAATRKATTRKSKKTVKRTTKSRTAKRSLIRTKRGGKYEFSNLSKGSRFTGINTRINKDIPIQTVKERYYKTLTDLLNASQQLFANSDFTNTNVYEILQKYKDSNFDIEQVNLEGLDLVSISTILYLLLKTPEYITSHPQYNIFGNVIKMSTNLSMNYTTPSIQRFLKENTDIFTGCSGAYRGGLTFFEKSVTNQLINYDIITRYTTLYDYLLTLS
jgi:hypothetical protein